MKLRYWLGKGLGYALMRLGLAVGKFGVAIHEAVTEEWGTDEEKHRRKAAA